jgi:hypothetical protein
MTIRTKSAALTLGLALVLAARAGAQIEKAKTGELVGAPDAAAAASIAQSADALKAKEWKQRIAALAAAALKKQMSFADSEIVGEPELQSSMPYGREAGATVTIHTWRVFTAGHWCVVRNEGLGYNGKYDVSDRQMFAEFCYTR